MPEDTLKNLEELTLHENYNISLPINEKLKLKKLILGVEYKHELPLNFLTNLEELEFGKEYDINLDFNILHNLKKLTLGKIKSHDLYLIENKNIEELTLLDNTIQISNLDFNHIPKLNKLFLDFKILDNTFVNLNNFPKKYFELIFKRGLDKPNEYINNFLKKINSKCKLWYYNIEQELINFYKNPTSYIFIKTDSTRIYFLGPIVNPQNLTKKQADDQKFIKKHEDDQKIFQFTSSIYDFFSNYNKLYFFKNI